MEIVQVLPAFLVAVMLISASPGPAMALIFRRAALRGFGASVATVLGLEAGIFLWAIAAGAGVAALVAASSTAYLVLQIAGASFLAYLGIRSWISAIKERRLAAGRNEGEGSADPTEEETTAPARSAVVAFAEGLLVQLANPKAAVFMFAFYPQFISPGQPVMATTALLALVQVTVETALYLGLAAGVARARSWFRRPVIRRRLEAVTGTVLLALAGRVLLTSR
ncbi:LysE family translocator [Streptomonospora sp. PA3]|uniref:LysE family translocator n=1 Tax=Streptomonospora sp. PA3 TaxID=2607326 RepID=UPI0012DE1096|nr:LysE family translocator [Streptomonospora sp. PA3]MUL40419.1 LysE family translocator [Streptomonospora sp. PA3]